MAIITISCNSTSDADLFAQHLSARCKWPSLSHESLLSKAAARIHVSEEKLRRKLGRPPLWWKRIFPGDDLRLYVTAVQAALAEACLDGDLVYSDDVGHLLLPDMPAVLRVLLLGSRASLKCENSDAAVGGQFIGLRDQERKRWVRFLHGTNGNCSRKFDLTLDPSNLTTESVCSRICAMAAHPNFAITAAARKSLADFALASRVKLGLMTGVHARSINFDVCADAGEIRVFAEVAAGGVVLGSSSPVADKIRDIAASIEGVRDAKVELRLYPAYAEI